MQTDDNDIFLAMRQDPERGLRLMMAKYGENIYWHLRRLLVSHDDAQDASQETFVKAYCSCSSLKSASSLRPWLYRIATNVALTMIERSRKPRELLEPIDESRISAAAPAYTDYTDLEAVKLQRAILSLPPKQQATFNMRYYDEMDYRQIADATATSVSTAKVNYHIAKEKIIKFMNSNYS